MFTCYGPQAGFAPRHVRRKTLMRLYYLECACPACDLEAESAAAARAKGASPAEAQEQCMARRARAQRLDEAAREAAREACELGSFAEAARLCEEALKELRGVFPPTSTMIAHEEAKLGMLRFNAWADAHAKAILLRAARLLEACHGDGDAEAHECRRLADMCSEELTSDVMMTSHIGWCVMPSSLLAPYQAGVRTLCTHPALYKLAPICNSSDVSHRTVTSESHTCSKYVRCTGAYRLVASSIRPGANLDSVAVL